MGAKDRRRATRRAALADLALRGKDRRAPDGRKLTRAELEGIPVMAGINQQALLDARAVGDAARSPDVAWLIGQFLSPLDLVRRRSPKLPERDLLHRAVAFLESRYEGRPRSAPRRKLAAALDTWYDTMRERRRHRDWRRIEGEPVSLAQFRDWRDELSAMDLGVIPQLHIPAEFQRALDMVEDWEELLERRGHVGERFSLREEVVRLHNWPGDQWDSGDDYASAQKRFHRRLRAARRAGADPVRDRIMHRALYLREGLLLNPVEDLEWFLAVCQFRWEVPEALDVRPELASWRLLDRVGHLGHAYRTRAFDDPPSWVDARDPRGVPPELLTAVGGPGVMIDLDEDVVTALPPGCRVRRLVVSARGPLGPDWSVYWVESEWDDARPILDLVESAKLHPSVVFVSDGEPSDLADLVRPFLGDAFEIPTNPLTAHSHIPGVVPRIPEHPDAGLS
ncbi:hypothetical protein [Actinomyces sp.]|uniref:hypothetical protein n=1 Tax=Actinomyces sp. TaxID=29317 RepID=UPI00289C2C1E|nr:hypothetical protein [Actinomyces sp.]